MPKKVVKSRASDVDAGTHDDRLYDKAFHPWRAKLRKMLLPIVRSETPWLAAMQKRIRTPTLDTYFVWTANLGTHTFFMIFLPLLVWFGNAGLGRSIACLTAFGVFWSGFFKDFMCLPRPLSPPVHRLTMSPSAALEYGFPSTHSTNSISVALYMVAMACESDLPPQSPARMACIIGSFVYAVSVVFGRIYCGMHSITDVIGGTLLAYVLFWVQWTFKDQFNEMFLSDSYFVFLSIPFCLILVGLHPDPIERCPCFEDSVCFMGVCIGLFPGSWLCYRSEYCTLGLSTAATSHYSSIVALIVILIKVILGVAILFIWRMACKRACYVILPPIYRVFNLPHRKFEIGARNYKSLHQESIHPIPSVLDLRGLASSTAEAEHVGIQSGIDLHEKRVAEGAKLQHRGGLRDSLDEKCSSAPRVDMSADDLQQCDDDTRMFIMEDAPLRYDVDIVTKLIVYAGIGFMAAYPIPALFQTVFPSSSI